MSVELSWASAEKTLICWQVQAPWTWEEFDHGWSDCHAMARSVTHQVDCLMDARSFGFVPKNMLQMIYDRYMILPSNLGIVVILGAPTMMKVIIDVMRIIKPETFSRYHLSPALRKPTASSHRNMCASPNIP